MMKSVKDVDGGLADSAGSQQVFNHMVAEEQHELLRVERGNRFKSAVGVPDSAGGDGMDMRVKVQAVSVALHRNNDTGQSGRIGGNLLEHLLERLPGGMAEPAEVFGMVFENGAQQPGNG